MGTRRRHGASARSRIGRTSWRNLSVVSPPTLADDRKSSLLELAVSLVILVFWAVLVWTGNLPAEGVAHWFMLAVGAVAVLESCYAGWRYLWPRKRSSPPAP